MKAYEFSTRITADGNLKLPDDLPDLADGTVVRVLVLIDEPVDCAESTESDELDEGFSAESFQKSWQQAVTGRVLPISQMWEKISID